MVTPSQHTCVCWERHHVDHDERPGARLRIPCKHALRLIELKALAISTLTSTLGLPPRSALVHSLTVRTAACAQGPWPPTPTWRGWRSASPSPSSAKATLAMRLRSSSPTTMGLIPLPFLSTGTRRPPHKNGWRGRGRRPETAKLVRRVKASSSSASTVGFLSSCTVLRCSTRSPEGPGASPLGVESNSWRSLEVSGSRGEGC